MSFPVTYRLMQYNILHEGYASQEFLKIGLENRKNNVASAIAEVSPDVLFLAERFEEWDGIGEGAVDLMAALPSHYAMVENTVTYGGESQEGVTVTNRTPIVYNSETFRLVESGYQFLTEEVPTARSGNKRGVTWAILENVTLSDAKGSRIAVFGTHWSTNTHWRTRESLGIYKLAQANEMQALIQSSKFSGLPVAVGGDFNVTYAECYEFFSSLLNGCNLTDAASSAIENAPNIVDHLAVSNQFTALSFCLKEVKDASDHFPIYCDVGCRL